MSRVPRSPERPLPDLGDIPIHVRQAVDALIQRNRRDLKKHGTAVGADDWMNGFMEGLYAAGGLRTRAEVNRVAQAIKKDVLDTLIE